ncbi:MAG: hypothetical protein RJA57_158 [Bacteroidota bacterium]|jgi:putative redox protein
MTHTVTTWEQGHEFTSNHGHNTIKIDGSRKNGFGPKALLLSAIASCSGIDVVDILQKMRVPLHGLEIDVKADQTEEHPRVFRTITVEFRVKAAPAYQEQVRKAIDLSLEKYCGVAAMLRMNSPIEARVILV